MPDRPAQTWDPAAYAANAGYVPQLGEPVLDRLAPRPGERVLDLGCGDGALTVKLAEAGAAVVGLDSSPEMVARARARGLDAREGDAAAIPAGPGFDGAFDAVFTNAALHWVRDHDAVAAGVRRCLKPGGRFVGEFGGFGNVAAVCTALVAVLNARELDGAAALPWTFPTVEAFAARLERHGFAVEHVALIPRPTPLPAGMAGWLDLFAEPVLAALPEADRAQAKAEAIALLRPALCDDTGQWVADYVRLRFSALYG